MHKTVAYVHSLLLTNAAVLLLAHREIVLMYSKHAVCNPR